jgi:hypothetical protein
MQLLQALTAMIDFEPDPQQAATPNVARTAIIRERRAACDILGV